MFKKGLFMLLIISCSVLANPMRPDNVKPPVVTTAAVTTASRPVSLTLQNIWIIADIKYATINNQVVSEGERVSGFEIIMINDNFVELRRGNNRRTLYLSTAGSFELSPAEEETQRE